MHTQPRATRPELWGPLTTTDLLAWLLAEHNRRCHEANRAGRRPSPAAFIAWEGLRPQVGGPWHPTCLPLPARATIREVQTRTWHA